MRHKILFCGYREWALEIHDFILNRYKDQVDIELIKTQDEFEDSIKKSNPSLVFFIGWSWIIDKSIVNKYKCICLHPSPLPKYRGGSPIQHQIIHGEKESGVTLFIMNEFIDKGPILWQESFSLDGDLNDIFNRIIEKGKEGVSEIIRLKLNGEALEGKLQNDNESTYFQRRTPDQSEIKLLDLSENTAEEIHNKIRSLQDPYPNAFILCKDGTKLFLQKSKVEEIK